MFTFKLKIDFNNYSHSIFKTFNTTSRKRAFILGKKWMNNCLAICGKDDKGNEYIYAEIICLNNPVFSA